MKKLLIVIVLTTLVLLGATLAVSEISEKNLQAAHLNDLKTLLPGSENFTVEFMNG